MAHLTLELVLWLLLAFFIGCIIGCLLRKIFTPARHEPATAPVKPQPAAPAVKAEPEKQPETAKPEPEPAPAPQPVAAAGPVRPKGLSGPKDGKPDELQRISGVGPKLEKTLHSLGFYHFRQIADWTRNESDWVDEHLRFKGRIEREEWIPQAKLLADGKETEFTRLYGSGGMKTDDGKAKSGERTRKPESRPAAKVGKDAPAPKVQPLSAAESVATGVAKAPRKLKEPRDGAADDLKRISGIGPKLEKTLHKLGFFHFDQVAEWTPDEVQWVDENLRFKGRIEREEWIAQAKLLAAGDEEKFAKNFGTGGLKDPKTGKTKSGKRTRRK